MAKKEININNYNDDAIQVLEGLDAVRKRPGMYIGSTDATGLHHLVWEIVDNAVDEALSGFGDKIDVTIHKDGSLTVADHGRGMPVGMHAMGIPTVEVIFTVLHAGGKFGQGGYKTSGGLHGVGSSVVNALSSWLEVEITRDGTVYRQRFEQGGKPVTSLEKIGKAPKSKTGTKVTFMPDDTIFSTTDFKYNTILERLNESAFLLKNVHLSLTDERTGESVDFHYENGVQDFVSYLNEDKETLTPVLYFEGEEGGFQVEVALQYNDGYSDNILSFVNNVRTKDGGTHETGLKSAITKVMNDYARKTGLLKEKDKNLEGSDYRDALCPAHGRFIADFVGLLRRDLTGRERLPDLKEQGSALHGPGRFRLVLALCQEKLSGGRCRIAEVGRHSSYLFRIEPVGKPILHCLDSRFSRRYLVGPDVSCSDSRTSFPSRKRLLAETIQHQQRGNLCQRALDFEKRWRSLCRHGHRKQQRHQSVCPRRQDSQYRSRGNSYGNDAAYRC